MGALSPIFGKYVSTSFWTSGFRSRDGMVTNRSDPGGSFGLVSGIVLVAISCDVRVTPAGTSGFAESFSAEKSAVYNEGCGIVVAEILVGETASFRSYAAKNQVFLSRWR